MTNISSISDQVPYIPVSIQSNQGIGSTIQYFADDYTVYPSFILDTAIFKNGTAFYASGLTIAREEDGSIVVLNNGDISIDSQISLSNINLTIISTSGSININESVRTTGRIVLMAPQGTITIASDSTLRSRNNRIILSAGKIQNQGSITANLDILLYSSQKAINNSGSISAGRIIASSINNSGSLSSTSIIADSGSGAIHITEQDLLPLPGVTPPPEISFSNNHTKVTIITRQHVIFPYAMTLSLDLEIISAGKVSIENTLTMKGQNLTIIANEIDASGDIDVSTDLANGGTTIGSINLYALTNITTGNLIADVLCNGQDGGDVINQTGMRVDDTAVYGESGLSGGNPSFSLSILSGTPIEIIACNTLSITNISATLSAQGGRGGNLINCTGFSRGKAGGGGGKCDGASRGAVGQSGGIGGIAGTGGDGGNGASFPCMGSHVTLIANQQISVTQGILLTVNTSGGNGGALSDCTGGCGGTGGQGGWNNNGGKGGAGGSLGQGGAGGCANNQGGQTGSVTILSCSAVTVSDLQCNSINNGGNGGSISGTGGQGGVGGKGGGNCPHIFGDIFYGGDGGTGGDAGQSGAGGDTTNGLTSSTSIITACGFIQIQNIAQNQFFAGTAGPVNSTPGAGGQGGEAQGSVPNGATGSQGQPAVQGNPGNLLGSPNGIQMVLISYENIVVPDITAGTLGEALPFQALVGLCGSGSVALGSNFAQLTPIPPVMSIDQNVSVAYLPDNTVVGNVTIISPEQTVPPSDPSFNFSPSFADDYQVLFNSNRFSNLALALTQNVHVEDIQITSFDLPQYMYPGASDTVSFTVNAQNGSGTVRAVLSLHDQTISSDFVSDGGHGKIFWADANSQDGCGLYIADFNPQLSDSPYNTKSQLVSTQIFSNINGIYIDWSNQTIYISSSSYGTIWLGHINQEGMNSVFDLQEIISYLPSPYGIFLDTTYNQFYWTDSRNNAIYVSTLGDQNGSPILNNQTTLLSNNLDQPTGLTVDTDNSKIYWTNQGDNTLWVGTINNLSDPMLINGPVQLLSNNGINQSTGVFVNPSDGSIYWVNSANGGELWKGTLNSLTSPTSVSEIVLLQSGNFGTANKPISTLSGLFILFDPMPQQTIPIMAPTIAGNHPITLTVYDSYFPSCSDVHTAIVHVIGIVLSDLNVPTTLLAGSDFTVSFGVGMQDPITLDQNYHAFVTFNGNTSDLGQWPSSQIVSAILTAPCLPSDYQLTIKAQNPNIPGCQVSSDFTITVIPLTVTAQASSRSIASGESATLSVSDPWPFVTYTWQGPGISDPRGARPVVIPPSGATSSYTVTAQSGLCSISDSISISAAMIKFSDYGSKTRTVTASSDFTFSFYTVIQAGGSPSDAFARFNGSDYNLGTSDFYSYTFQAPCTPGDYTLVVTIQDTIGAVAYLDFNITVKPFQVKITASPQSPVEPFQQVTLTASTDPFFPNATYSWTSSTGAAIENSDQSVATAFPGTFTTYTVIATNGTCSFSDSAPVRVRCEAIISDLSVLPNPVLAGAPISVTFTPIILNGSGSNTVTGTISIGNVSQSFTVPDGVQAAISISAPCVVSNTVQPLSIMMHDSEKTTCKTSSDIMIAVNPLTVKAMVSPKIISFGDLFTVSVSDPISDVIYTWEPGPLTGATQQESLTSGLANYTVTATSGSCAVSDSVKFGGATVSIPKLTAPQKMCAGTTSDISFQIEAQNGTGTTHAVVSFNGQTVFTSDVTNTWTLFFGNAEAGNSSAGIYTAKFIPLFDGPYDTNFLEVLSTQNNDINSVYVDALYQKIYWIYGTNNELWVANIDTANPTAMSSGFQQVTVLSTISDDAYGLFVDSLNGNIYWTNSQTNEICVRGITGSSSNILLSDSSNGVRTPTGFFLDTNTGHVYWTNRQDNSLWTGTLNHVSNPTYIQNPRVLSADNLNQPCGVCVNPADETIYWVNSANGGELWQASIFASKQLNTPIKLTHPLLLSQGNFGTASNPNTLLSGLCILFPPPSYSCPITAPSVGGSYPLILTVNDSDLSSKDVPITIYVSNVALSDINVPATVLAGSSVAVTVTPLVTNGSSDSMAIVTLSLSDRTTRFIASDNQAATLSILAPCVASDTIQTVTIMVQDHSNPNCSVTSDIQITVQPLNVQIVSYILSDAAPYMFETNTIMQDQEIMLSVVNPQLPSDAYIWTGGNISASGITISDVPTYASTEYTVTATVKGNGRCSQQASTTIIVNKPHMCVTLSDITLTATILDPRARFPTKSLTVTGYQFSLISDALRTVQVNYGVLPTMSQTFDTDGQFSFSANFENGDHLLTLTAFISDNPICIPNVWSDLLTPSTFFQSRTITINYAGSVFTPVFHLPPDLSTTIHTSDINLIFSDICTYAKQQLGGRFVAGLEILEHADVLPSDALILQGSHMAFIFCSDNDLYAQEIFQGFTFVTSTFTSDTVTIKHIDVVHGTTIKSMQRTGFSVTIASDKLKWWSPDDLRMAEINVASTSNLIDLPLLSVSGSRNPITNIEEIICLPICETSSDAQYVCQLCTYAKRTETYLDMFYPNFSDLPIAHKNRITYTGEITANIVTIDLDRGMICFSDFLLPHCSDATD